MQPQDLVEIRAIEQLKYRYLRFLDLKQWDDLATTLTEDASASYGGGTHTFDDRNSIMEFLHHSMSDTGMLTTHKAHHPEIELTGPDTATGIWALEDVVVHTTFNVMIEGAAYYYDDYRKVDDMWLISQTGYKRVYEQLRPIPADVSLTASWWSTDGKSSLAAGEG